METLQQLSNESFSHNWQTNTKTSFEFDPNLISLHQTPATQANDFGFSIPSSHASMLVHADQLFSNGLLLPLHHVTQSKSKTTYEPSDSTLRRSLSLDSSSEPFHSCSRPNRTILSSESFPLFYSAPSTPISQGTKLKLSFLRSCARKYLCFLLPLCKKVKSLRLVSRKQVRTSPITSAEWCRGSTMFDMREESLISEAVLHCKKSIAQGAKWMVAKEQI